MTYRARCEGRQRRTRKRPARLQSITAILKKLWSNDEVMDIYMEPCPLLTMLPRHGDWAVARARTARSHEESMLEFLTMKLHRKATLTDLAEYNAKKYWRSLPEMAGKGGNRRQRACRPC